MDTELDERKRKILKAIIQTYLETGEPVGSRTISKYTDLNLSSATIRNEMSDLEEMGYILQPHTSAGRIPSDKGYRFYVDTMLGEREREVEELKGLLLEKDEKMDTLVDSIRKNGILNPVIVRPDQSGNYEMISGHRRLHAARIVGLKKIPAIVKEMSDDEAIIKMVDANIQREEILPSEKAFAYKMKLDALKRTAGRPTKENACHNGTHLRSDQELALQVGDSARSIQRYVRLTELVPELLDYVDNKKIGLVMAVDLSYLDEQVQKWVYEYFKENGFLKSVQVEALKNYPNLSNVTQFSVISIMNDALPKKSKESKLSFSAKKLDKYFPPQYSTKERENIIIQLLEQWSADQVQSE